MANILIVDDVTANRRVLVTLLEAHGHRTLEASDGGQGLAVTKEQHPDLIITDVLMPVMDGYELVRQLRLDPAISGIPVVFNTAHYGEREARELAISSGVAFVMTKPTRSNAVLDIVGRALAGQTEPAPRGAAVPLADTFDAAHLRLLTDKLSAKTGDLRVANARLRAVINIGLELSSVRESEKLLESICSAARDLFGATYVTLGILNPVDGSVLRSLTCEDEDCGVVPGAWINSGEPVPGVLRTVIDDRRSLRGENGDGDPARLHLPARHPEIRAFLAAPITSATRVYGWICLVCNDGRTFTEEDEGLILALSGQVGRIYELEHVVFERHAAETALRNERDWSQRYLDTAEIILVALDTKRRITMVNRYACSVLGWTQKELLGQDWVETCVPMGIRDLLANKFNELLSGSVLTFENPVLTRSGEERLFEWRNTLLRNASGEVIGTISSGTDITARKQAEVEGLRSAALAALGAAIGLSLAATDSLAAALQQCAEALVLHLSAALARIWTLDERAGVLTLEATAGLPVPEHNPHAIVALGESAIGRIARDRKPLTTNTLIGDPQGGDQEWVKREGITSFAGYPLVVNDRVVGVLALFAAHAQSPAALTKLGSLADHIALGIERHWSAEALGIAEERMRYALDAAGVGIWDMDYLKGVQVWSETLEAQYGLAPGSFGGTFEGFVKLIHPEDREAVLATIDKAMQAGADFSVQHRNLRADGSVRWLRLQGRVQVDALGKPVRAIGISIDITEQRILEEQYQQAQKMEAIGQLAGGVAHDFNNLLTGILGYCELLLSDLDTADPHLHDVAEIQKAGLSAAGLTRQLLAFSRKQIIEPTRLDVNLVIEGMRTMLERLIGEHVKIVLGLDSDLAPVRADRGQIEQIVMNLAVNARDAMPAGGTLTIETANIELDEDYSTTHLAVVPGHYVVLTVTDSGTGMSAEVQARLFEPFFTTKEVGKGTGLGLATVHGIVKQSGGSVNVYSEINRGTSFKVYLPRDEVPEAAAGSRPAAPTRQRGDSRTVLVVEDSEGLRELTTRLLQRQGFTVMVAGNAEEATQMFDLHPSIEVLLTDVVMPGISGPELAGRLLERRPGLRVVYMSGYTEDAIVQHGVLKPGIAFLHKPFTSDMLGAKLNEVLDLAIAV